VSAVELSTDFSQSSVNRFDREGLPTKCSDGTVAYELESIWFVFLSIKVH